jgi:hypothetical protein
MNNLTVDIDKEIKEMRECGIHLSYDEAFTLLLNAGIIDEEGNLNEKYKLKEDEKYG